MPALKSTCSIADCDAPAHSRGWCRRHYGRWQRRGDPQKTLKAPNGADLAHRLWVYTDRGAPGDCWEWRGGRTRGGYGIIGVGRQTMYAHRVAFFVTHGPIPKGLCVCHTCDNPPCCNPAHLWLGTNAENAADMVAKGRLVISTGERSGASRLTWRIVDEIRSLVAAGPVNYRALGRRYGVDHRTIGRAAIGESWRPQHRPGGHEPAAAAAMAVKTARGEYIGGDAPYGWRLADDRARLVPDPAERAAVELARDLRAAGLSLRKVAVALDARGYRARSGRPFVASQVARMVAHEVALAVVQRVWSGETPACRLGMPRR